MIKGKSVIEGEIVVSTKEVVKCTCVHVILSVNPIA